MNTRTGVAIRFESLFYARAEPALQVDDSGHIILRNRASESILPSGAEFASLFANPDEVRQALARASNGACETLEVYLASDGDALFELELIPAGGSTFALLRDLRSARTAEAMLMRDHERFRSLFEYNPDPVMLVGLAGNVDRVNEVTEDFLRAPVEHIVGAHWTKFLAQENRDDADDVFFRALGGEVQEFETEAIPRESDRRIPVRITHIPLRLAGEVLGTSTIIKNIAFERTAYDYMHRLAFADSLTGLPNRALFTDRLDQMVANAKRYTRAFALFFLDLDGFKAVNDRLGHAAGDSLLRAFADRFASILRESDTFARLGGDEFAVLQPVVAAPAEAATLADKLLTAIAEPFSIEGIECSVGLSIGVALFPSHGVDAKSLLQAADRALYQAKGSGKGCYRFAATV